MNEELGAYNKRAVTSIEFGGERTFTSRPWLFWAVHTAARVEERFFPRMNYFRRTAVAMQAANVECGVPGKVWSRGDWEASIAGYIQAKFYWTYILMHLDRSDHPVHISMAEMLRAGEIRTNGTIITPDWPVAGAHREQFEQYIDGIGNYASYAIARLYRDGICHFSENDEDAAGYLGELTRRILEIEEIGDDVDFVLQVANIAVELGLPVTVARKHAMCRGFLVGEHGLQEKYERVCDTVTDPIQFPNLQITDNI